jgi:hypothetical protein
MGNFKAGNKQELKIWTGLADVSILAVNPTMEELKKLGIEVKKEPEYHTVSDEGIDKTRVDFWIYAAKINLKTKLSFFLENKVAIAMQSGNMQFINDFGQSTWAKSLEDLNTNPNITKWFKTATAVPSMPGLADLIDCIKSWLSTPQGEVAKIDDVVKLCKGNVSELKPLVTNFSDRKVQVLLYEKNGYQAVYSKYFSRAGNTKTAYWEKALLNANINYQNSLKLKEYEIGEKEVVEETETNPWGG